MTDQFDIRVRNRKRSCMTDLAFEVISAAPDGKPVMLAACPTAETAELVRRACLVLLNSHAALLEACTCFRDAFLGNKIAQLGNGSARRAYDRICAAIALTEGQPDPQDTTESISDFVE